MDKKEEELISMHYQMEKTDIKQQQLEDRLISISEDLKRSKRRRNFYFVFILVLILLLTLGSLYLILNKKGNSTSDLFIKKDVDIQQLVLENDSLQREVYKLKSNISKYQYEELSNKEDSVISLSDHDLGIKKKKEDNITDSKGKSKRKFEKKYCYINKVYKSNDVVFIEVDIIEYYRGRKAVKKAKEFGEAEYDLDKNGDTLYFLYNNYYIHNQSSSPKILELDDKARVKIDNINQISSGFLLKAFQKVIADKPVLILEINNGIVYKITEQKLP
jgi:cell division protein FtsB